MLCRTTAMFAGKVQQTMLIADQPVVVLDGQAVLNSFAHVEDASRFLARTQSDTALIVRHNGLNWDIVPRCMSSLLVG